MSRIFPSWLLLPPHGKVSILTDPLPASHPPDDVPSELRWLLTEANNILSPAAVGSEPASQRAWDALYGPEKARELRELHALRNRAEAKFSHAQQMFFTRRSLEQATDEKIAIYKGKRYAAYSQVLDLCCGIGGDALGIAMAQASPTSKLTLVDRDPRLITLAATNLSVYGIPPERRQRACTDALAIDWTMAEAWHVDPDRRTEGRRHTNVDAYQPSMAEVLECSQNTPGGGIKLAPAAELAPSMAVQVEREWIGHRRECQQQVAWVGELAQSPGQHVATVLEGSGATSFGGTPSPPVQTTDLKRFLFEPHPTVLAAALASTWARAHNLTMIAPRVMYFTTDESGSVPLSAGFEVLACLPYRLKTLRKWLKTHDAELIEVKKRHVPIDPAEVLRALRSDGAQPLSLLLFPRGPAIRAILAKRMV